MQQGLNHFETAEAETVENFEATEETTNTTESNKEDLTTLESEEAQDTGQTVDENPAEKLARLQTERMGNFKVTISHNDATYVRNLLEKSEYRGPQQAYLLIISKLEMMQVCEALKDLSKDSRHQVELSAAAIESISFFMNNHSGKGLDSAQKLFAASMQFRPAISAINSIEDQIESLKKEFSA